MTDQRFPLTATEGYKTLNYDITTLAVKHTFGPAHELMSQSYALSLRTSVEREMAHALTSVVAQLYLGKRYSGEARRCPDELVQKRVPLTIRRRRWFYHLWKFLPKGRFAQGGPLFWLDQNNYPYSWVWEDCVETYDIEVPVAVTIQEDWLIDPNVPVPPSGGPGTYQRVSFEHPLVEPFTDPKAVEAATAYLCSHRH